MVSKKSIYNHMKILSKYSSLLKLCICLRLTYLHICCRRPSERCDHHLTWEINHGQWELSTPSPFLEMCVLLAFSSPRSCSKDRALNRNVLLRLSGLGTWLNPVKASIYTFKILASGCRILFILQLPKISLISFLIKSATYQSGVVCLFLLSLHALCEYGGGFRLQLGNSQGGLWTNNILQPKYYNKDNAEADRRFQLPSIHPNIIGICENVK